MKYTLSAFFLLLLSSCAQTGYQTSYIISDTAKEPQASSLEEKTEDPR